MSTTTTAGEIRAHIRAMWGGVAGGWEQSGQETFGQKRGGLTPETPVRDADKPGKGGH